MKLLRRLMVGALTSPLLLIGLAPGPVEAAGAHAGVAGARAGVAGVAGVAGQDCPTAHRSPSTTTAPPTGLETYYREDWRLGPSHLPRTGPVARMLRGWKPQDSTSPYWFLGCYWQTDQQNKSGWWYPDNDGFVLRDGRPVHETRTLAAGQMVDLFGSGRGNFLAPQGTPYIRRAIPPTNLDEYNASDPAYNYHLYKVVKPFTVEAGPIRPWFGQPGLGTQYVTNTSIPNLVNAGNLKEVTPAT
ncbi:TNT domain-containing protein [Streptomyces sp. NPDC004549]|uniref:TNT domain-containing protein n=1 Tax=Streptomyces sp. NPDC004549 TaxID=3154283 RepID=UPI0033BA3F94